MPFFDFKEGQKVQNEDMKGSVIQVGSKKILEFSFPKGFNWKKIMLPQFPGCPSSCPLTHFGYVKNGAVVIKYDDGTEELLQTGQAFFIPPGHLPEFLEDTTMVEFGDETDVAMKGLPETSLSEVLKKNGVKLIRKKSSIDTRSD
uniref:Cupin 2 conserved barrel domain-containing protein n=1 Tax=Grammatophora oceanica TaxID=210454 RepID=A0A7S1UTL3_9STRA|mmetsp:Transcript_22337/g.33243  ORF Transcript_22337/g.33243 Transcript_22337/m.33243 type:complete len:145 (+) Transcript_22337:217-651(+)|eukprot:CAMPEP_0194036670 /NCGR_PEP_ID=MMETSP0009_2-20130614/9030_1 /TAXON_ID=210454 /ORGANISM="Grammatophora oceanica, Strain CCMP 410" /LENGTH=144 /DNA_ID=CAMNT_0038678521 /DNA_START=207 /DNA_END=641 /DNA_ORIENTATION=-